jgi:hypothetical protein
LTGVLTIAVVVVVAGAGGRGTILMSAKCVVTGVIAATGMLGVVGVNACTASATTRVASMLAVGAAGGFIAALVLVVCAAIEANAADAAAGGAWRPGVGLSGIGQSFGRGTLRVSGVAIMLAAAVGAVESGSDRSSAVGASVPANGERVGGPVCAPPVPATAAGAAKPARLTCLSSETEWTPPELLTAIPPGGFSGPIGPGRPR